MKILKLLMNRVFITTLLILIQIVWFIYFLIYLTHYSTWISAGFTFISIVMIGYLINKEEPINYKLSWIVLIALLPLFGGLFYLFFGGKRTTIKMKNKLESSHMQLKNYYRLCGKAPDVTEMDIRHISLSKYIQTFGDFPVFENQSAKYFPTGELFFEDLLMELDRAEKFIFLEYFIISNGDMWNRIEEILMRKAEMGVEINLIFDDFGSMFMLEQDFDVRLSKSGINCLKFNPYIPFFSIVMNHRDHRKILVIDGNTAYTGGINLADEYINQKERFGYWKDTAVKITGSGTDSFTLMFIELWNAFKKNKLKAENYLFQEQNKSSTSDVRIQPFGDSPLDRETVSENIIKNVINIAVSYVYIYTPYLILDEEMKNALVYAAKRGVDVKIFTPGIPDKKIVFKLTQSNYQVLTAAGVSIYEYSPGFLHGKVLISDDEISIISSVNLDYRSLYLHFECGVVLFHKGFTLEVKKDILNIIKDCKKINYTKKRSVFPMNLLDAVLRLLSPLL